MGYKYPKVLVATPTYEGKDYIFKENFEAIKGLSYPNFEYVYIDNSKSLNYARKLRRRGANVARVPRGRNSRDALSNAQNYARTKCLEGGFDYLLFIESDLVPPPDTIQRLMNHNKLAVGATYFIGTSGVSLPCIFFKRYNEKIKGFGSRIISPDEVAGFLGTGVRECFGCGVGTMLIKRSLVEKFKFWHDERFANRHSDVWWNYDLDNAKIPMFVDTNLIVEHFPSKWTEVKDR